MKFRSDTSLLIGGTLVAQALSFVAIPLIASIYTPNDFAVLGVIVAFIGWLSPVMSLRLDMAIPIACGIAERKQLAQLSIIITIAFSLIFFFVSVVLSISELREYAHYVFFISIGCFFYSTFNVFQNYNLTNRKVKIIAISKVSQTVISLVIQIFLGKVFSNYYLLVVGQIILGGGAGIFILYQVSIGFSKYKILKYKILLRKYAQYPRISTIESFLSSTSSQLPFVFLSKIIDMNMLGLVTMSMKLLGAPAVLIGKPFSQIYTSSAKVNFEKGQLLIHTTKTISYALFFGGGALISLVVFSKIFSPYLFGAEWDGLFEVLLIMLPYYLSQMIASPIMYSFHVLGRLKFLAGLQVTLLVFKLFSLSFLQFFSNEDFLLVYSAVGTLSYILMAGITIRMIIKREG